MPSPKPHHPYFFPEDKKIFPEKLDPEQLFSKFLQKILLYLIPFLIFLNILDFFFTFLGVKHYQIATEQNIIASCLFDNAGFFGGFIILESIYLTNFFFLGFAIYFADPKNKVARKFLYFSAFYLLILLIGYIWILPNNLWVLVKFWFG